MSIVSIACAECSEHTDMNVTRALRYRLVAVVPIPLAADAVDAALDCSNKVAHENNGHERWVHGVCEPARNNEPVTSI